MSQMRDSRDEWVVVRGSDEKSNALRYFWICRARSVGSNIDQCATVTASTMWIRPRQRSVDGSRYETKQRWYCPCCGSRYRKWWGMYVQVVMDIGGITEQSFHCRAEVPGIDLDNLTDALRSAQIPIPASLSSTRSPLIVEADNYVVYHNANNYGVYKITNRAVLDGLRVCEWGQILTALSRERQHMNTVM
jgi:hypothetical protein